MRERTYPLSDWQIMAGSLGEMNGKHIELLLTGRYPTPRGNTTVLHDTLPGRLRVRCGEFYFCAGGERQGVKIRREEYWSYLVTDHVSY